MRFAIVSEIPVEVGNALEKDPKAVELLAQLFEKAKPEAGYFGVSRRYVILIVNAESIDELTKLILPLWHTFKTYPQVEPVASIEEFKDVIPKLQELTKGL